jgi:hypothetical protein
MVKKVKHRKSKFTTIKHAIHFQRALGNRKGCKTWTFFQYDLKFKISLYCTSLQHGETTTAGLWSMLKMFLSMLVMSHHEHHCVILSLTVFWGIQDGAGISGKTIATRPHPKVRQIDSVLCFSLDSLFN